MSCRPTDLHERRERSADRPARAGAPGQGWFKTRNNVRSRLKLSLSRKLGSSAERSSILSITMNSSPNKLVSVRRAAGDSSRAKASNSSRGGGSGAGTPFPRLRGANAAWSVRPATPGGFRVSASKCRADDTPLRPVRGAVPGALKRRQALGPSTKRGYDTAPARPFSGARKAALELPYKSQTARRALKKFAGFVFFRELSE